MVSLRLLVVWSVLLCSTVARADEQVKHGAGGVWVTTIDLLTIGPGEHLWSRMGHSALMVFTFRKDAEKIRGQVKALRARAKADPTLAQELSRQAAALEKRGKLYKATIYNWGDADFDASDFEWQFLRGTIKFRISRTDTLPGFVELYARSNRNMVHQRLNLTAAQVKRVSAALERNLLPQNRYYPYHHMGAGCATKIRDLLDRELGGILRKQFDSQPHPLTARDYGRRHLAGHLGAELFSDLFMGRLHDRPFSKYYAMFHPEVLAEYLQQVQVPDPKGSGDSVPLLTPVMSTLCKRQCPAGVKSCPPTHGEGRSLIHLSYLWIALLVVLGVFAYRAARRSPTMAGGWLLLWTIPMGLAALAMVVGALASTVIEGRINELMLSFPVTDVALIVVGVRWYRGKAVAGKLLRIYAMARLAMVLLALVLHGTGVFYQEPRIMLLLALVATSGLVVLTRRVAASSDSSVSSPP